MLNLLVHIGSYKESGALILLSERVLGDYTNYYTPKAGIKKENVESLKEKTSSFSDVHRYTNKL